MRTSYPKLHSIKFKTGPIADNVVHVGPYDRDIPVINVLQGAAQSMLTEVVVFGYDKDGYEYIASSTGDTQRVAYMFARGHLNMLRMSDD